MKYLHFDVRALSLMRILVACIILLDLTIRLSDLEAFYSNSGVLPLAALFENVWNPYYISVHTISGLWQVQLILFLFSFFCAFMLLIGYRTTLFTCLCWFMMLSLHNRNGLILQGGDDLLRMVLFWCMFIPWGERYSCDRSFTEEQRPVTIVSIALIAYLLQLCYIYTGSALLKGPEWSSSFTAIYYAYSVDQIVLPPAKYIYYHQDWLKMFTCIAYYFELFVPVLFFIPFKHGFFRTLGVILIIAFHLINNFTLFIGLFPYIGMVTSIGMLPSGAMDRLDKLTQGLKIRIQIFFLRIAKIINRKLPWKRPLHVENSFYQNTRNALLIFLTLFVFDWNFSNTSFIQEKLSDNLRFIGYGLRLDQNWGMFAPGVFKQDGWYILEGINKKKEHIDLLNNGKPINYRKPEYIVRMFKNDRWRKYSENFIFESNEFMRGYFCNYYTRIWNENHPENAIVSLQVIYMEEMTLPDYRYSLPQKRILWECKKD